MPEPGNLLRTSLRTPRAAAVAGILFSVLLSIAVWLLRLSIPADPRDSGQWLTTDAISITVALNLLPFAGIAFLWFIGVLRDRLAAREDRFFATVFLGSALLFLAMLFSSAAVIAATVFAFPIKPEDAMSATTLRLARAVAYNLASVYAIKMAGVFMFSASTLTLYTKIVPRWMSILGYLLATVIFVGSYYLSWSFIVLPIWVLLISVYILTDNFRLVDQQATAEESTLPRR